MTWPVGYRGKQVLSLVRETIATEGEAPSYSQIRDALDFHDRAGVCRVVERLERRGLVERGGTGRTRRIKVLA